jgi:hypothetical protein
MDFDISPPSNITNLFGNCLYGVAKKYKSHSIVFVCALLWAIWHMHNEFIFNKANFASL